MPIFSFWTTSLLVLLVKTGTSREEGDCTVSITRSLIVPLSDLLCRRLPSISFSISTSMMSRTRRTPYRTRRLRLILLHFTRRRHPPNPPPLFFNLSNENQFLSCGRRCYYPSAFSFPRPLNVSVYFFSITSQSLNCSHWLYVVLEILHKSPPDVAEKMEGVMKFGIEEEELRQPVEEM